MDINSGECSKQDDGCGVFDGRLVAFRSVPKVRPEIDFTGNKLK
ncbi:hypothetical protein [Marivirga sp.]